MPRLFADDHAGESMAGSLHPLALMHLRVMARLHRNSGARQGCGTLVAIWLLLQVSILGFAQSHHAQGRLDPTLDISTPTLESTLHAPLPEQYIWGSEDGDASGSVFLYYRKSYSLGRVPPVATLYVAGPNYIRVYINGRLSASGEHDATERIRPYVLAIDVSGQMRAGRNLIAVVASQGDRLVLKIVPAPLQIMKPAVLVTDATWKFDSHFHRDWETPGFDDRTWPDALSLGGIEEKSDFFQGNGDAGMYRWPGYDGVSPFLAHVFLKAKELVYGSQGMGEFRNISALLESDTSWSAGRPVAPPRKSVVKGGGKTPPTSNEAEVVLPARPHYYEQRRKAARQS